MSDVEKLAEMLAPAFDEWLFRMHGVTSSCDHVPEAEGLADAILASDWLRERDGINRILGAIRGAADADEAYTALVAGVEALIAAGRPVPISALRALIGEPVEAEHVPGCNPGCDETGHVLGGDGS